MDDTTTFADNPIVSSPTYTYTDPISSFFGGIFFIIILVLIIIFVVVMLIGRGVGIFKDTPPPAQPPKKEGFKGGPPYPHCQTNGSFAMF
jgi:hypothetical protein